MPSTHSRTHPRFYYDDLVTLKVEERLYGIPKIHLTKSSSMFHDMFAMPQGSVQDIEGTSDDNPIVLVGCSDAEFERLLEVLIPEVGLSADNLTLEDWFSVLRLATMWDMVEVRSRAIRFVSPILAFQSRPVQMVSYGRMYRVASWLIEGYCSLARYSPHTVEELAKELGWEAAAKVAEAGRTVSELSKQQHFWLPKEALAQPRCYECCSRVGRERMTVVKTIDPFPSSSASTPTSRSSVENVILLNWVSTKPNDWWKPNESGTNQQCRHHPPAAGFEVVISDHVHDISVDGRLVKATVVATFAEELKEYE